MNKAEENSEVSMLDEVRYKNLLEKAPFPIVITKIRNGRLCYANQRAKDQFGFHRNDDLDVPTTRFYHRLQDRDILIEQLKLNGAVRDVEIKMRDWRGNPFWALVSASEVEYEQESAFLVAINDITARKQIEEALKESEERYRLLAEYTSDVIWVLNFTKKQFTYVSPSVEHLTGFTVEEIMAQSLEESLTPESLQNVVVVLSKEMKRFMTNPTQNNSYILEVQQPCKNGQLIWVEFSLKFRYNAQNEIEIFGVSRNIDDRKRMENEVLYLSYHDQLTGLYNRRYYEEQLEIIDRAENLPIALIMADVNGLKLTNDAFGHLVGDRLLMTFSDILKNECRKNDIMARVGGDEFVILLPNTTHEEAETIMNRIKKAIANKMVDQISLSVSFGLKAKEHMSQSFTDIYKQAEDYMYRQKLFEGKSFKGETIKIIIKTLYEKYPAEKSHGERVSELCQATGVALGLSENEINELGMVGLLHDIGKIGLEENVLDKPGKFNADDWHAVKRHPEIGYQILRSVTEFADIAEAVLAHHEKLDGTGYPKGLKGDAIPYMSKVVAVADAFDAMTSTTVYRVGMTVESAVQELKKYVGTQFDEKIARVFVEKVLERVWE